MWKYWPDVNRRNIAGTQGVESLTKAFEVLAHSDGRAIIEDLVRKGVAVSFGEAQEFANAGEHATAVLVYSTDHRPPATPGQLPVIKINPKFLHEDPRLLAAVLAYEGTHFQQYLDGTIFNPIHSRLDGEVAAWMNGAAFWREIRREPLPFDSPLAKQAELGFQVARQGEGPLGDLLAALYPGLR